jgi:regulatory protein
MSHHSGSRSVTEVDEQRVDIEQKATELLARRGHARRELRDKLLERGFEDPHVEEVLDVLEERGTLDDERFARHQAELLIEREWGPRQVRKKLAERGVDRETIDQVIDTVGGEHGWWRRCWERTVERFGDPSEWWEDQKIRRAFRHLEHRGFPKALIRRVLFDGKAPPSDDA